MSYENVNALQEQMEAHLRQGVPESVVFGEFAERAAELLGISGKDRDALVESLQKGDG